MTASDGTPGNGGNHNGGLDMDWMDDLQSQLAASPKRSGWCRAAWRNRGTIAVGGLGILWWTVTACTGDPIAWAAACSCTLWLGAMIACES